MGVMAGSIKNGIAGVAPADLSSNQVPDRDRPQISLSFT